VGTAIQHRVPDWFKPSLVIFDIRALCHPGLSVRVPGCQKLHGLTRSGSFIAVPISDSGRQSVNLQCNAAQDFIFSIVHLLEENVHTIT